ncbi:MAG TPA: AAA family ATPase, partial [Devosiaceae bacterium]|nr:AAA family ATPase [Devosiaceae bacterium]
MSGQSSPEGGFGVVASNPHSLERLPRPLADSYRRLKVEATKGTPAAVAWTLRDAWDCALRFVACLGLADLMRADPRSETLIGALSTLSKRSGLSLEDWMGLLAAGCDPAAAPLAQRLLPGLTTLPASLDAVPARLTQWRDRLFASEGRAEDQHWRETETAALIAALDGFYAALTPILEGWVLREGGPEGPALMGGGEETPPEDLEPAGAAPEPHEHVAMGKPENVVLARADGASLAFGSLFWAQTCAVCAARQIFFCDRDDRAKAAPTHGRLREIRLPRSQRWERGAFDREAIGEGERLLFRSFAADYLRPDWIMDRLWQAAGDIRTGYLHLEGPAGTGKSFIARAMKQESGTRRGMPALLYHILPGERTDYRNFIMLLADEAREQFRARVQEIQSKDQTADGLRAQFREFLAALMQANGVARLILVLDGLDELPSQDDGQFSLADFLVPASDLPPGCLILLTGRASLRDGIARRIAAVRAASGEG